MLKLISYFSIILSVFCVTNTLCQNPISSFNSPICFWDTNANHPVTIINDSIWVLGFDLQKQTKIPIINNQRPNTKNEDVFESNSKLLDFRNIFHTKSNTYLVEEGCGAVLKFQNDSLIRIDNSFSHRNQYMAATFSYGNQLHYFSGLGLFTVKNIVTRYDFKSREWFKLNTNGLMPDPIRNTTPILMDDALIVFGGLNNSENPNKNVYQLDLLTNTWTNLGNLNIEMPLEEKYYNNSLRVDSNFYFISESHLWEVNPLENLVKKYTNKDLHLFSSQSKLVYYDKVSNNFHYTYWDSSNNFMYRTLNMSELPELQVSKEIFYLRSYYNNYIIGLLLFLFLLGFYLYKGFNFKFFSFNGIVYDLKMNGFYFKGLIISEFTEKEKELILFLLSQNSFVPIKEINKFVEDLNSNSLDVINKRRQNILKNIELKILRYSKNKNEIVFSYQKNQIDRRINMIRINSKLIKK